MKRINARLLMAGLLSIAIPSVFAESGTLTAQQVSCPPNYSTLGYAELDWSVTDDCPDYIVVGVSVDSGAVEVFASGRSGTQSADWLQKGHNYIFYLDDRMPSYNTWGSSGVNLANVNITCS